jgi:hypothetical protein
VIKANNISFGGAQTLMQPAAAVLLLLGMICVICLPRKYACLALLAIVGFLSMTERVVIAGQVFTTLRLLILACLPRVVVNAFRRDAFQPHFGTPIDKAWVMFNISLATFFTVKWFSGPAVINQMGFLMDMLGGYVVLRYMIRDKEDVRRVVELFGVLCCVFAVAMSYERMTMKNFLSFVGGVDPWIREGTARAQGTFVHAILAGVFGATLLPIFFGYLRRQRRRAALAYVFSAAALTMVITCYSSTPLVACAVGICVLCCWHLRHNTRPIRYGIYGTILGLHIVMKAPVWALIQRMDVGGGTGYHRFVLVDETIRHFWDWCLVGVKDYGLWGHDMWDLANAYVTAALSGGLLTFILLIVLLRRVFSALSRFRSRSKRDLDMQWTAWGFTAATVTHAFAFFGITYMDQTKVLWMAFLVMVGVITAKQTPRVAMGMLVQQATPLEALITPALVLET